MLRMIFVTIIIVVGLFYAAQGPFYALLFYLWNAYFRPEEWTSGGTIRSLHLSFVIGAYLVLRTALSMPSPQINGRTLLIFLFFVQAVIGVVASEDVEWSLNYLNSFYKVLLISYLMVVLVTDRDRLRLVLLVMAFSLGFETAKQGWVNLYRSPGAINNNTVAFLGDNNGVALGTMMLIPLFVALAQTSSGRLERLTHRFVAIGVFLRGFSTYSRGGFIAATVLAVFLVARSKHRVRAALGVAAATVLLLNIMPAEYWNRMQTINAPAENRDDSAAGRLHFWSVAMQMAEANPMTGVGLNQFNRSYPRYNDDPEFGGTRAAHSIWFGVLGDLGYPGLILFVANWWLAVVACVRVARQARRDPTQQALGAYTNALLTSLVIYGVAGSFLSHHYNEMAWHMIGLSTALLLVSESEATVAAEQEAPRRRRVRRLEVVQA